MPVMMKRQDSSWGEVEARTRPFESDNGYYAINNPHFRTGSPKCGAKCPRHRQGWAASVSESASSPC